MNCIAQQRFYVGGAALRRFSLPVEFVVFLEIRGSIFTAWPSVLGGLIPFPSESGCLNFGTNRLKMNLGLEKWAVRGSNPRPIVCKTTALPLS